MPSPASPAMNAITAVRTGLPELRVRQLRANSTILSGAEAWELGLATDRGSFSIPRQGRWWQV
ncbi:hypothetical protein [Oleisolibacter albus]|uniref:hypothetical protein n=1 Tax=Oleisolibacter albus TaxID=2171757 RepID=UPI001EFDA0BD|nr:hypothetical protein [Oleisolibacter albus]